MHKRSILNRPFVTSQSPVTPCIEFHQLSQLSSRPSETAWFLCSRNRVKVPQSIEFHQEAAGCKQRVKHNQPRGSSKIGALFGKTCLTQDHSSLLTLCMECDQQRSPPRFVVTHSRFSGCAASLRQLAWRWFALICLLCMQNVLLLTLCSLLLPLFLLLFSPSLQCISQHQSSSPLPSASSPRVFVTSGCRDSSLFAFFLPSSFLSSLPSMCLCIGALSICATVVKCGQHFSQAAKCDCGAGVTYNRSS